MNIFCFEKILNETKKDKKFSNNYLSDMYGYNMGFTSLIKTNGALTAIKCFYPLPTRFLLSEIYSGINKIVKIKNEYQFHGISGNRIIFADKKLPFISDKLKYPIPFSFPVHNNSNNHEVEILISNVYYYEVTLLKTQNKSPWYGETI